MPLLDPFHEPLRPFVTWESIHTAWMTYLAVDINTELPQHTYYALPSRHFGLEIDIVALERLHDPLSTEHDLNWTPTYTAGAATATIPFAPATDELEVLIYGRMSGELRVVGAIELISPANKHDKVQREAFVSKCHGYLQKGIGLVLVDVVTERHGNLHNDLMDRLGSPAQRVAGHLYAASYRPTGKNGVGELGLWIQSLAVGKPLPEMPFWLYGGICVPVRLEATYDRVCRELRVYDLLRSPRRNPGTKQPQ